MTAPLAGFNELYDLVGDQCEGRLTVGQVSRIEELVLGDAEQRRRYILCMHTQGQIERARQKRVDDLLLAEGGRDQEDSGCGPMDDALPAPAGFARSAPPLHPSSLILHPSGGFGSPVGVLLSYAMAAVIFGAGAWGAWTWQRPEPAPQLARETTRSPAAVPGGVARPIVAKITQSVGCDWADPSAGRAGTGVALDSCISVPAGRLEITYNMGARVLIEGPAVFAVDAPNGGFLRSGKVLVQMASGERDARAQRWEKYLKGVKKGSPIGPDVPMALADHPAFCIRFSEDSTGCHAIMSDRGGAYALSLGTDGSLVGYILASPVWMSAAKFDVTTPALLQGGASILAGVDKNGASRLAVGQNQPPAASLHGLLEGKSPGISPNRGQHGS